jgi:peptidyl-prolyl cis-trans isomerase B (cyclophilin B)
MALSGPDTGGSQWFVTHSPQPHLNSLYTIFGQIAEGQAVVERIGQGERIVRVTVVEARS